MISLTLILVVMTSLISYQAFNNPAMMQQLTFRPALIKQNGEFYRFLTSGFVHGSWSHLLINMFVLYQFGEFMEGFFSFIFGPGIGKIVYIIFYLSAIIIASIPTYFRYQDNFAYGAVGASGATSALIFGYILYDPWQWFIFPPLPALILGVGYLFYSSYMDKKGTDNIGHNAHFWGAVYGLLFTIVSIVAMKPDMLNEIMGRLMAGPGAFGG
ncbi:MAG: rhomboid family intramembrane serine protease [Saprospiraceae bacterium]|nr:MAG: rhomboid family intramembrane serine protease [Saprospiraceae bacterium]